VYVNITGSSTVYQLDSIVISGILHDDQNIPISNRDLSLEFNGTLYRNATSNESGEFTYRGVIDPINATGTYEYSFTFYSETGDQPLGPFYLTVRAYEGPATDLLVILLWVGVIVIEMAIALVLITRKRFSFARIRQIHTHEKIIAKNNQQAMLMLRWL
jgi:hypothetical protein